MTCRVDEETVTGIVDNVAEVVCNRFMHAESGGPAKSAGQVGPGVPEIAVGCGSV